MYLLKIHVKNFKSFEDVIIHFNKDINIFTGANNSGKTTVLEAIALWNECFEKLIVQIGKADTKRNIQKGDFILGTSQPKYVPHTEIVSVRSPSYEDIFYNLKITQPIFIQAQIQDDVSNKSLDIGFTIRPARGNQYEISLDNFKDFDFNNFNVFLQKLPESINLTFASPVANLKDNEDFETLPKIKLLTNSRASVVVLRNRIYQLKKNSTLFNDFVNNLKYVLSNSQEDIIFTINGDEARDTQLKIDVQIGNRDVPKAISLLGSGSLQIIEILLSLYEGKKDINLILLDEPDSHIHRDIQKRLLEILVRFTEDTQVFLTTHNEALIRSALSSYLFHIEAKPRYQYRNISFDVPLGIKKGLQPTPYLNIINSISGGSGLDFINALESDKIVLVEGEDDARYISILLKAKINNNKKYVFWSFEGIGGIFTHIASYKDFFSAIKNEQSLWKKSVLIFDKDYLSIGQKEDLRFRLNAKLNIPVYIGQSYTFESSILTDIPKFVNSIYRYLLSKQKTPILADVEGFVEAEIFKIVTQKKSDLKNDVFLDDKAYNHKGLSKKLSNPPLSIVGIWDNSDLKIRATFKSYIESNLSILNIHQISNKNDVEAIINGVCQNYGLSFSIDPDFIDLLQLIVREKINWFSEWDNIIGIL
jgi:AAA15 family ATPase/GTPase